MNHSVGGGSNDPLSRPPGFSCPDCADPYATRCGCKKHPCPICGTPVFFKEHEPEQHVCARPFDPALHMAQAISRAALEIFNAGRAFEKTDQAKEFLTRG